MAGLSSVGRALLSDAFEFDFAPVMLSMKQSRSTAADKPCP